MAAVLMKGERVEEMLQLYVGKLESEHTLFRAELIGMLFSICSQRGYKVANHPLQKRLKKGRLHGLVFPAVC